MLRETGSLFDVSVLAVRTSETLHAVRVRESLALRPVRMEVYTALTTLRGAKMPMEMERRRALEALPGTMAMPSELQMRSPS